MVDMTTTNAQDVNSSLSLMFSLCDPSSPDSCTEAELTKAPAVAIKALKGLKVYNVQPRRIDSGNRLYLSYEPMNGVQTASILGGCLFLVIIYICYKTKCRKSSWTSDDQLYLERYRRKMHARCSKNNNNRISMASSRWSTGKDPMRESLALENTVKWIQSQPLHTAVPKGPLKTVHNMCNICVDSCHSTLCPMCSDNGIHTLLTSTESQEDACDDDHQDIHNNLNKNGGHIPKSVNTEQENLVPPAYHLVPSTCRLENCRSTGSSLSDSVNLDKHIDIAIHNKSPERHRSMKPRLKYIPLFTLPVTNISLIPSTNLSPKSPLCLKYAEDQARRKARNSKKRRDSERKTIPEKRESVSMRELGRGLSYIDSADEQAEEDLKSPLKLSVSNL